MTAEEREPFSNEGVELNENELAELESMLAHHAEELEAEFAPTRSALKARISESIERQELISPTDFSRRRSRFILYTFQLVGVLLIALIYLGTLAGRIKLETQQKVQTTHTELRALRVGIRKYKTLNQEVPTSGITHLIQSLTQQVPETHRDLLPLDKRVRHDRLHDNTLFDPWGQPYVWGQSDAAWMLYSVGPNGKDEAGGGDDISVRLD